MLASVKAVSIFVNFAKTLFSRGELNTETIQQVIAMGDGIRSISHRQGNSMDDLLAIVHIIAKRGSVNVLPYLPKTTNSYQRPAKGSLLEIITIFRGFISGPLVNKNHLQEFVEMETDVMKIANEWRVDDIISVVGAVAEYGTTNVLAALQEVQQ